jgi:hypothetical protein
MYPTAYTGFLQNSSTLIYAARHDTVQKTSITLYIRPRPTCYSHQHAQRAITTQFLRLHSTFSFCSLTRYVLFVGSSHFHLALPHSTLHALLNLICSKVWKHSSYVYISSSLPKIHPALSDICRNNLLTQLQPSTFTDRMTNKQRLPEKRSFHVVTRYTQFPFPHLLRRFRERKKTQPIPSRVWRGRHREKSESKKRIKSRAQLCTLKTRQR